MDEDSELQARIARLSSLINRSKTGNSPQPHHDAPQHPHGWIPRRGTPYGVPRGRGYRSPKPAGYRNRTLVINSAAPQTDRQSDASATTSQNIQTNDSLPQAGWVTKNDRHMQLINNSVYEQKARQRSMAMEETRQKKQQEREEREKSKLANYLQRSSANGHVASSTTTGTPTPHQIFVGKIRFIVADHGSKLIKAQDESNLALTTPKRAVVGGVTFFRSRHGNLYRAGLVKMTRSGQPRASSYNSTGTANFLRYSRSGVQKVAQLCPQFTSTGSCPKGPQCRYTHDPEKVAICRDFLQTGKCAAGDDCDLSHDPTPERAPACLHFARGNCTNPNCRYAHVKTSANAPVCRDFGILGYCAKGLGCVEKHVHECPDYANKGICRKSKCPLPHVDRAGQLRKASSHDAEAETAEGGASSDVSSDAELDSDDFDSDGILEDLSVPLASSEHELSQQKDYVEL